MYIMWQKMRWNSLTPPLTMLAPAPQLISTVIAFLQAFAFEWLQYRSIILFVWTALPNPFAGLPIYFVWTVAPFRRSVNSKTSFWLIWHYFTMGCGASNSNASTISSGSRPSRAANTTTVPVQRSGPIPHKPLVKSKNYRHGSNLTQVCSFLAMITICFVCVWMIMMLLFYLVEWYIRSQHFYLLDHLNISFLLERSYAVKRRLLVEPRRRQRAHVAEHSIRRGSSGFGRCHVGECDIRGALYSFYFHTTHAAHALKIKISIYMYWLVWEFFTD